jgi:ribonuclease P protein component
MACPDGWTVTISAMEHGFPPAKRLTTPAQFAAVMQQGKRRYDGALALHALRHMPPAQVADASAKGPDVAVKTPMDRAPSSTPAARREARLGLVVGKKLARTSVERNRIKRQAREVFRQTAVQAGCDIVVRLAKPAKTFSNAQLRASLRTLLAPLVPGKPVASGMVHD